MIDDELRDLWAPLHHVRVPDHVIEGVAARTRDLPRRPARRVSLTLLAAAATVVIVAIGLRLTSGVAPVPAGPSPTAEVSASPSPTATGTLPATIPEADSFRSGVVAVAVSRFSLVADRPVEPGQKVFVVEGPRDREGVQSVLLQHWGDLEHGVRPDSDFGWLSVAEAVERLRPVAVSCPSGEVSIREAAALQLFERPLCFGSRDLTFGPVTASNLEYGGRTSSRWLSDDGRPDFFTGLPFTVRGPDLGIDDGEWVEVTGHFDDESAAECASPAQVAWCRQQFVVTEVREAAVPGFVLQGTWRQLAEPPIGGRREHVLVWTGVEMVVWGGFESSDEPGAALGYVAHGAAYDPNADGWRLIPEAPIEGRDRPVAAWTGRELVVWGGYRDGGSRARWLADGAAWDPATDQWRELPPAPAGTLGTDAVGGWTGDRFVVVTSTSAASWDPATDAWTSLEAAPVRQGWRTAAIADGRLVIIAFGDGASAQVEGAVLDPGTGGWTPIDVPLDLLAAGGNVVAAGDRVVVPHSELQLDPVTAEWSAMARCEGAANGAAWTGRYLIGAYGAWDADANACRDLPLAPFRKGEETRGREFAVGVWTGDEWITWSGGTGSDIIHVPNDGVAFRPASP